MTVDSSSSWWGPRKYKFLEQPRRSTHKDHYLGNMSADNVGNTAGGRGQRSRR